MSEEESKNRVLPFVENISEATAACLITMVQGNVLALGLSHWLIASQTGIAAGVLTALAIMYTRIRKRWVIASALGIITATVDFFVHPGMFGHIAAEAIVTGIGAACLSLLVGWILDRRREKASLNTN
ncbi:MAG: hypothetical protein MI746_02480 [Pseudomonadales bacterium]|nr:hypothetical protein [Pseudomonadales bacterium]